MLVTNEDGVEACGFFADDGEAGEGFAAAKAGVDKDACASGVNEGGVAGTAAGQDADLNDGGPPGRAYKLIVTGRRGESP